MTAHTPGPWHIPPDDAMCSERVFHKMGFSGSWDQCTRKVKVGAYCTQHDPERVRQRREAQNAKWKTESDRRREHYGRQAAETKACAGLSTEALEAGVVSLMLAACENAESALRILALHPNGVEIETVREDLTAVIAKTKGEVI